MSYIINIITTPELLIELAYYSLGALSQHQAFDQSQPKFY
jgi:hypothetical protein